MSPKKHRTRRVSEAEAKSYLKKAEEFYQTMLESCRQRRWNSAGLNGVHCAISATDAAMGIKAGLRSAGESHYEAVELLSLHIKHENAGAQSTRLTRILGQRALWNMIPGNLPNGKLRTSQKTLAATWTG